MKQQPIGYIDAADLRELSNGSERQYSLFAEDKGRMIAIYVAPVQQAEQKNTQFMEGYRIGLAEMREKCAKACEEIAQDRWNLYKGRPPYTGSESGRADPHEQGVSMGAGECAAAIRAIKFEGDIGFRPVSEMIAEHKQDPKKAAAIEKAKMRKAEQKPVAWSDDIGAMPFNTYCKAIVNWGSRSNCGESYLEGKEVEVIVVKYGMTEGSDYTEPKPRFAFLHTGTNQYRDMSVHVCRWKPM